MEELQPRLNALEEKIDAMHGSPVKGLAVWHGSPTCLRYPADGLRWRRGEYAPGMLHQLATDEHPWLR